MRRRNNPNVSTLENNAGIMMAKLYRNYPYLLHTDVLVPGVQQIESGMMFNEKRALLRLKESVWMNKMTRSRG